MHCICRGLAVILVFVCVPSVVSAQDNTLPDPLSIEDAIALASALHPLLSASAAEQSLAAAELQRLRAADDARLDLALEGRWIDPPDNALRTTNNDSYARLTLQKQLHDFGRTRAGVDAAEADLAARELQYQDGLLQQKLQIIRRFFDVLLADLEYARDNEAMAVAFINQDRAQDRNELGQVSDIDLLEAQSNYQQVRIQRHASEARQRSSRALLAQALNRPESLSSELVLPDLVDNSDALPDYGQLLAEALENNARLKAARSLVAAAQRRIDASRASWRPVLSAEIEAAEYERQTSSRYPVEAGLILEIPLYQGERVKADVARDRARLQQLQAGLLRLEYDIRQDVLETWQAIQRLQAQRQQAEVFTEYRELALDRSRARYELDLETNFGDSLVGQSEARLFAARVEFELALARTRLSILTGKSYSRLLGVEDDQAAEASGG